MGTSFTGHIVDIAGRRTYPGTIVCEGAPYYLPGLTDAHVHIESSMMTPANFAKVAVTHGVVGAVSDPHEMMNYPGVIGRDTEVMGKIAAAREAGKVNRQGTAHKN